MNKTKRNLLMVITIAIAMTLVSLIIGQHRISEEIHNARLINTVCNQSDTIAQDTITTTAVVDILNDTLNND